MDAPQPPPPPPAIPRPRNYDPYRQYIRRRHHRWQARPYRNGRHNLGTFRTYHDARRAVVKFFEGKLQPLPRFVRGAYADGRPCHCTDDAEGFVGEIRTKHVRWRSRVFPTREEAHAAAVEHLTALVTHVRDLLHPHAGRGQRLRLPPLTPGRLVDLSGQTDGQNTPGAQ